MSVPQDIGMDLNNVRLLTTLQGICRLLNSLNSTFEVVDDLRILITRSTNVHRTSQQILDFLTKLLLYIRATMQQSKSLYLLHKNSMIMAILSISMCYKGDLIMAIVYNTCNLGAFKRLWPMCNLLKYLRNYSWCNIIVVNFKLWNFGTTYSLLLNFSVWFYFSHLVASSLCVHMGEKFPMLPMKWNFIYHKVNHYQNTSI